MVSLASCEPCLVSFHERQRRVPTAGADDLPFVSRVQAGQHVRIPCAVLALDRLQTLDSVVLSGLPLSVASVVRVRRMTGCKVPIADMRR